MSLIEFIGFIISFIAMIVLFFRNTLERRRRNQDPAFYEQVEHRKAEKLKEFLRALDVREDRFDEEEDEEEDFDEDDIPPPKKVVARTTPAYYSQPTQRTFPEEKKKQAYQFSQAPQQARPTQTLQQSLSKPQQDDFFVSSPKHYDPYALKKGEKAKRASTIIRDLQSPQDMIILHEIIGRPKSLRAYDENF